MATTDGPRDSGYQPSPRLREHTTAWEAARQAPPKARAALEDGIAQELTDNRKLNLPTLAEHLPWSAEAIRLMMAGRGVPPRERHRKEEGDPPVYTLSDRLRDLLAAWHQALDDEKKAREALEECIADEMRAHPNVTDAEMAEHTPWGWNQVRLIANKYRVPGKRKRANEHKLQRGTSGKPLSVIVPFDWYVQQPGADQRIIKEASQKPE
ncbi:hypothetical protein [Streptomyces werraensis]|uniref:hypothetical protein n=1 Tax=Streptomyces werraensis TaxID=68284 RepID=UPI0037D84377